VRRIGEVIVKEDKKKKKKVRLANKKKMKCYDYFL